MEYLIKLHTEREARALMDKYATNLWGRYGLAYFIGRESLEYFCLYFLQDTFTPKPDNNVRELAPLHYELWGTLQSMFVDDSFDRLEAILPRGSSKTTTCNYALTVWAHCYRYSIFTVLAGKTDLDAVSFLRTVRESFETNPYIRMAFGELVDAKNKRYTVNNNELELTNQSKITAISSATSMRGKKYDRLNIRPTLVIADDYQSGNDIITQEARDKKYALWVQDVGMVGDKAVIRDGKKIKPATKFVVLGTLMREDCFMSRLLKDPNYTHIFKRAADIDNPDEYFNSGLWAELKAIYLNPKDEQRKEHARAFYDEHRQDMQFPILWPDKWDCFDLATAEYYPNPRAFKQELQNDVSQVGQRAFHQLKTMSPKEMESNKYVATILAIDPAVETTSKHDYNAMCVTSKADNGFKYVRKGIVDRLDFDGYIGMVMQLLRQYKDITTLWVEKNTFSGADVREIRNRIAEDSKLSKRGITIINEQQTKNKEAKIRAIQGKVDSGFIIFNEDDALFNEQVLNYEGEGFSAHDDAPDILAEADRLLDTMQKPRAKAKFFNLADLGL